MFSLVDCTAAFEVDALDSNVEVADRASVEYCNLKVPCGIDICSECTIRPNTANKAGEACSVGSPVVG